MKTIKRSILAPPSPPRQQPLVITSQDPEPEITIRDVSDKILIYAAGGVTIGGIISQAVGAGIGGLIGGIFGLTVGLREFFGQRSR